MASVSMISRSDKDSSNAFSCRCVAEAIPISTLTDVLFLPINGINCGAYFQKPSETTWFDT
jgi:hypothetical protein